MKNDKDAARATMENRPIEAPGTRSEPDNVDEASDESFPASAPPAKTPITGVGCPCPAPGCAPR